MTIKFHSANKFLGIGLIIIVLAGVILGLLYLQGSRGNTITVCAAGCDFTTIQDAIDDPNTIEGFVINITDLIHTEGGVLVNKNITIQGQGAGNTIVQAHGDANEATERVFYVRSNAIVIIRGMTIRHGNPSLEPQSGGGIRNEGELTIENCIISHNQGSAGGGILNDGTLKLVDSAVSNNKSTGGDTFVECNTGGGIKNLVGMMTLINSTVSDNVARGKGGGFHIACKGTLVLINSTVSGNSTNYDGGGIYLDGVGEFTNSTIVNNSAHNGGGIYIDGSSEKGVVRGMLSYTNTIIADNTISFTDYGTTDCMLGDNASIGTNNNNLVEDGSCEAAYSGDPQLSSLSNNGGDINTHAPSPGSPVVDVIPPDECIVDTDQRGIGRPSGESCDIGAIEFQAE